MNRTTYPYFLLMALLFCLLASSCQRVINLDLTNAAPQLVIEGNFTTTVAPQMVKISQTVPFSNTNIYPPVSGATVTVSNNKGRIITFAEGPPGTYASAQIAGRPGNTYTLTVQYNGKVYTANSTMPQQVLLDSIDTKQSAFNGKNIKDANVYYLDPYDQANQYRFVLYVNSTQVNRVFAFDDHFTNGRLVVNELFENDIDIHSNDTVTVEMQCIDPQVYTYWYSLRQQQAQGPGGGTTPSNPPSNISNNALGYFSAHTTQTKSIIVP